MRFFLIVLLMSCQNTFCGQCINGEDHEWVKTGAGYYCSKCNVVSPASHSFGDCEGYGTPSYFPDDDSEELVSVGEQFSNRADNDKHEKDNAAIPESSFSFPALFTQAAAAYNNFRRSTRNNK